MSWMRNLLGKLAHAVFWLDRNRSASANSPQPTIEALDELPRLVAGLDPTQKDLESAQSDPTDCRKDRGKQPLFRRVPFLGLGRT